MKLPQINSTILLQNGRKATIMQYLGEGAQGAVFLVDISGRRCALKLYKYPQPGQFLNNLKKNIEEGAPSPLFLWPEAMVRPINGYAGYTMPLRPEGYHEFSKFRLAKVRFRTVDAMLTAALEMCSAFRALHATGLSFQDLNDGGFFINPDNGHVLVCDCDNVFPHGEISGIMGKARYIAPEVVSGKTYPDSYSDRFSMAVMMFMIFCLDHPFEGFNVVKHPCMTEELERRLFGEEIRFIFDPADSSNRPVRGLHRNALTMWPLLPKLLRQTFCEEFSAQKFANPQSRLTEQQWTERLLRVRDTLTRCPACGDEIFADGECRCFNPRCGNTLKASTFLSTGSRAIPVINGTKLRLGATGEAAGRIIAKPSDPSVLLIQNLTESSWNITTPTGRTVAVPPRGFCPANENIRLTLVSGELPVTLTVKKQ